MRCKLHLPWWDFDEECRLHIKQHRPKISRVANILLAPCLWRYDASFQPCPYLPGFFFYLIVVRHQFPCKKTFGGLYSPPPSVLWKCIRQFNLFLETPRNFRTSSQQNPQSSWGTLGNSLIGDWYRWSNTYCLVDHRDSWSLEVGTDDANNHIDVKIQASVLSWLYVFRLRALCACKAVDTPSINQFDTRGRIAGHLGGCVISQMLQMTIKLAHATMLNP